MNKGVRTAVSAQAAQLSKDFEAAASKFTLVLDEMPYRLELSAPDEPSTGGGARARQHLRLASKNPAAPAHLLATVDLAKRTIEVRTYAYLVEQHRRRFPGRPMPLSYEQHEALVKEALPFFIACRFAVSTRGESERPRGGAAKRAAEQPGTKVTKLHLAAAAGAILLLLALVLLLSK